MTAKKSSAGRRSTTTPAADSHDSLAEYHRKRNFASTPEPAGHEPAQRVGKLRFVVQKHDATQLHYDLRLELDGTMKSWAVPKGPSANPAVKRLAMQVEDHPISYNAFEGTIPQGEYGGGTVMLWDVGTYTPEGSPSAAADEDTARAAYDRGDFKVSFHGERLLGSYVLVRTRGFGRSASKPSWLLIKHRDDQAIAPDDPDLTDLHVTSVATGRTMDEIAAES